MIGSDRLIWNDNCLSCRALRISVAVVQDETFPGMYRVRLPNGGLTDMVNYSRAKDAAKAILLSILNARETVTEGRTAILDWKAA
jgi:hypothetical protein